MFLFTFLTQVPHPRIIISSGKYGKELTVPQVIKRTHAQQRCILIHKLVALEFPNMVQDADAIEVVKEDIQLFLNDQPLKLYTDGDLLFFAKFNKDQRGKPHSIKCHLCSKHGTNCPAGIMLCCQSSICAQCLRLIATRRGKKCWKCETNFSSFKLEDVFVPECQKQEVVNAQEYLLQMWYAVVRNYLIQQVKL